MFFFQFILPEFICLAFGIIAIVVVNNGWRPDRAKPMMIGFLALFFVFNPCVRMVSGALALVNVPWVAVEIVFYIPGVVGILSSLFLMAYIILRTQDASDPILVQSNDLYDVATNAEGSPFFQYVGSVWNTESAEQHKSAKTMRKREWSFLIDILPFVFMLVGLFSFFSYQAGGGLGTSPNSEELAILVMLLMFLITGLLLLYIPIKDCRHGVSMGKRISGCRAVDFTTGRPIGLGQSLGRNIIFLIPFGFLVELVVANVRQDKRRLGDLIANTMVVTGPPATINGIPVETPAQPEEEKAPTPHPLDD